MIVWVLVHDLGRSGVPVDLARMAEWNATQGEEALELHVVAGHDGPLRARLASSVASLMTVEPEQGRSLAGTVVAGAAQLWPQRAALGRVAASIRDRTWRYRTRRLPPPEVVLVHGAGAWNLWRALVQDRLAVPYVVHLHELQMGLDRSVPEERRRAFLTGADLVLAVDATIVALAREEGVSPDQMRIVSGAADDGHSPEPATAGPHDGPTAVVGIGPPGWRKGADRFVAVAHEVRRSRPDIEFHWIGGEPSGPDAWARSADLPVTWHPLGSEPWSLVPPGSMLLVPSREDPLPLIVLEAAIRGIPVVASATSGLPALLAEGRGLVVPGHDLAAMADAVLACVTDPTAAYQRAEALRAHVDQRYTAAVIGPNWQAALIGAGSEGEPPVRPVGS